MLKYRLSCFKNNATFLELGNIFRGFEVDERFHVICHSGVGSGRQGFPGSPNILFRVATILFSPH